MQDHALSSLQAVAPRECRAVNTVAGCWLLGANTQMGSVLSKWLLIASPASHTRGCRAAHCKSQCSCSMIRA